MSTVKERYLANIVTEDVQEKMIFMGGPRQVGKTTLAWMVANKFTCPVYLNWDARQHRTRILEEQWSPDTDFLVLDEVHKYRHWKSHVKGIWDTREEGLKLIVTGSSKLNMYRRSSDSLMGRYYYVRLHPFSMAEINGYFPDTEDNRAEEEPLQLVFRSPLHNMESLLTFGGFPEPFLKGSKRTLKRWQNQRFERIFREDIRDTENIRFLSQVELLGQLLPERVASPISIKSLSEDIEAGPKTVKNWLDLLERNYFIFRVPPYHKRLERALKKESKYYLWDWSEVGKENARFENLLAGHLLKYCHLRQDAFGDDIGLHYVRDKSKREVDFLITWNSEPWLLAEAATNQRHSLTNLSYFARKLNVSQAYLVTLEDRRDYIDKRTGIRVIPANTFLTAFV